MLLNEVPYEHFTKVILCITCSSPMKTVVLYSFSRFRYCGSEKLINLSKVTQQVEELGFEAR